MDEFPDLIGPAEPADRGPIGTCPSGGQTAGGRVAGTSRPRTLGVILARYGSTGVPAKCFRKINGQPVWRYTEGHAIAAGLTDVVITTDQTVVKHQHSDGVIYCPRPQELCHSRASVQETVRHAVWYTEQAHLHVAKYDIIVVLYGNVPIRHRNMIGRCVRRLIETGADSVRTVVAAGKWHPHWALTCRESKVSRWFLGSENADRRQDLSPVYYHDGGCIALRAEVLTNARPDYPHDFFGRDQRGLLVGRYDAIEIDDEDDLRLAEALLKYDS